MLRATFVLLLSIALGADAFLKAPQLLSSPALKSGLSIRPALRGTWPLGLQMNADDEELSKKFQQEKETRDKMDKIFKDATSSLEAMAKSDLDAINAEADELAKRREEEWEIMGAKAAESLTSKVDSLAENFLKSTGKSRSEDDDDLEEFQRFLGPQVVAIIGKEGPVRDAIKAKVEAQGSLSISSCESLLDTRGLTIETEGTDSLIFIGDSEPLDRNTVERLIGRAKKLRFVVLISSLGTRRSDLFPFSVQNAFSGVLDKKRLVELGIEELSKDLGFSYTQIRIGKVNEGAGDAVKMLYGDEMTEDVAPSSAAEAALQSLLLQPTALNSSFSIISEAGPATKQADWDDQFLKLDGPELWREALGSVSVDACRDWLKKAWATKWIKPGSGLTTPVDLVETANGIQLVFKKTNTNFMSFKEEKAREKAREKGELEEDDKPQVGDMEGGLEVVVESKPFPRVRALRCNMAEETVVKESSESLMMSSLSKDVRNWIKSQ